MQPAFLPISPDEIHALGWKGLDVLLVSGDAYVDHPSFAMALLGRRLTEHGLRVAVLPQPAWKGEAALRSLAAFPRPRLFAGVGAGAMDSMLAHYTAFRKKRHTDAYTPGGRAGARPNRAVLVYTGLLRQVFPDLPIILGGIEASLRRVSHYDFWSDSLRQSILPDSKADLLLCGMAEQSLVLAAELAEKGTRKQLARAWYGIPGAVTLHSAEDLTELAAALPAPPVALHSHMEILQNPGLLLQNTLEMEKLSHQGRFFMTQAVTDSRSLLLAPPPPPLSEAEMDRIYALPFKRLPHPSYTEPIPAWEMIRTSITTHRGCGGGCSFCSLALHQGRRISSRSRASILKEAQSITQGSEPGKKAPPWAGSISDVGGPSANMWQASCTAPGSARCARASCLFPRLCPHFAHRQTECVSLLRETAALPGVRHLRVASGLRFDLALLEPEALRAYARDYAGGQLKIAPEHISADVLRLMRKPSKDLFERFLTAFDTCARASSKDHYVIPYLMSAFPGCKTEHMRELGDWLRRRNWSPRQVQCFIPTPGTVATAMYYTGLDSAGRPLYVAKSDKERLAQHRTLLGGTTRRS